MVTEGKKPDVGSHDSPFDSLPPPLPPHPLAQLCQDGGGGGGGCPGSAEKPGWTEESPLFPSLCLCLCLSPSLPVSKCCAGLSAERRWMRKVGLQGCGVGGNCCQMPRAVGAVNTLPTMLASLDPLHLLQAPAGEGAGLVFIPGEQGFWRGGGFLEEDDEDTGPLSLAEPAWWPAPPFAPFPAGDGRGPCPLIPDPPPGMLVTPYHTPPHNPPYTHPGRGVVLGNSGACSLSPEGRV